MVFLLDLMICYGGIVIDAYGKFLFQFEYGNKNSSVACNSLNKRESRSSLDHSSLGECLGTLAATAIANSAYKALVDFFQKKFPLGHP